MDVNLEDIDRWVAWAGAWILFLTPLVYVLQKAAHAWLESSLLTPSPYDDKVARALVWCADGLAKAIMLFPRVTMNLDAIKALRDAMRKLPKPPAALILLVVVSPFLASATGCGGTQMDRARTVLSVSGQAVVGVEQIFAPRYTAATNEALENSETFDEYADAIKKWNAGAQAILLAGTSLRVADSTLDAIDQGMDGDVAGVLACVGVALVDVMTALDGLVDIPDALMTALHLVSALAGSTCTPTNHASILGVPHISQALALSGDGS